MLCGHRSEPRGDACDDWWDRWCNFCPRTGLYLAVIQSCDIHVTYKACERKTERIKNPWSWSGAVSGGGKIYRGVSVAWSGRPWSGNGCMVIGLSI